MTTVQQPREKIGKLAFQNLLKIIDNGNSGKIKNIMLKPKLIIRDSVKKIT
jgi:DNA-binding LacI/PurR family transcriptional regulator